MLLSPQPHLTSLRRDAKRSRIARNRRPAESRCRCLHVEPLEDRRLLSSYVVVGVDDLLLDGDVYYGVITTVCESDDPAYWGVDPDDVQLINEDDDGGAMNEGRMMVAMGGGGDDDVERMSEVAPDGGVVLAAALAQPVARDGGVVRASALAETDDSCEGLTEDSDPWPAMAASGGALSRDLDESVAARVGGALDLRS